jgi:hypothetical protein
MYLQSLDTVCPATVCLVWKRPKAWTVFARSKAVIVSSSPVQGIDVCVRLFCICVVLCVGSGLRQADHSFKESKRLQNWRRGQGPTEGCRAVDEWVNANMIRNMKNAFFWDLAPCRSCVRTTFFIVTAVKISRYIMVYYCTWFSWLDWLSLQHLRLHEPG